VLLRSSAALAHFHLFSYLRFHVHGPYVCFLAITDVICICTLDTTIMYKAQTRCHLRQFPRRARDHEENTFFDESNCRPTATPSTTSSSSCMEVISGLDPSKCQRRHANQRSMMSRCPCVYTLRFVRAMPRLCLVHSDAETSA
jgi:hypothetical protein